MTSDTFIYLFSLFIISTCLYFYTYDSDTLQLKCIVSSVDGNKYCVRDRKKLQDAADLLAKVTVKLKKLVNYMNSKYPTDERVQRMVQGFNPKRVMETLPTSTLTAYSENKGEKMAFCLNPKKNVNQDDLIDEHTLTFVAIHELSHIATKSIGHKMEFWDNFKFVLGNAKESGIHEPKDYHKSPKEYCSMKITDNPYHDM